MLHTPTPRAAELTSRPRRPSDEWRSAIDARLHALIPATSEPDALAHAMRCAVLSPGKRVRPLVLLETARSLGVEPHTVLDPACALELVHSASLVLDDLPCMDDARLRRGQPALHVRCGEDVAVLAAVGQLSLAFRTVAAAPALAPALRAQMVGVLADAVGPGGMVQGQLRDLQASAADPRDVAGTNHLKTGSLFAAAMYLAALAARADEALRTELVECAADIGQAFQLLDDLKDTGDVHEAGKPTQADAGKPTLVAMLGARRASQRLAVHVDRLVRRLRALFPADDGLVNLLFEVLPCGDPARAPRGAAWRH